MLKWLTDNATVAREKLATEVAKYKNADFRDAVVAGCAGQGEALKLIGKLKAKPEEAQLLVRVCCAIGAADGDFDELERAAVRTICAELGLDAGNFDL